VHVKTLSFTESTESMTLRGFRTVVTCLTVKILWNVEIGLPLLKLCKMKVVKLLVTDCTRNRSALSKRRR